MASNVLSPTLPDHLSKLTGGRRDFVEWRKRSESIESMASTPGSGPNRSKSMVNARENNTQRT